MEIQDCIFRAHFTPETLYKRVGLNSIATPATHSHVCHVNILKERTLLCAESLLNKSCCLTGHLKYSEKNVCIALLPGRVYWPLEDSYQAPSASSQCRK